MAHINTVSLATFINKKWKEQRVSSYFPAAEHFGWYSLLAEIIKCSS